MIVAAKKANKINTKSTRVYVDYERILSETIEAIPAPIKGDKGDQGDSIQGDKGDQGDAIKGDQGDSIKGDKGDSIRGDKGESIKGDQGDQGDSIKGDKGDQGDTGIVDPKDITKAVTRALTRALSADKTLADFEIKKGAGNTIVITKLYKDGTRKTDKVRIPGGGGGGGGSIVTIGQIFSIANGESLTIPAGRQFDHLGRFIINGRKIINGRFTLGIGVNN